MSGYFTRLEAELVAVAGGARRRRGRRTGMLIAALLLLAGVPAIAVSGGRDEDRARDPADRLLHDEPIARGTTPNGARWELLASKGADGFCFGVLTPTDDPRELAPGGGVTCGETQPGELTVQIVYSSRSADAAPGPSHSLLLGTAPDAAVTVQVAVRGESLIARTFDDPEGIEGRFYVAPMPASWRTARRHARALDARGRVVARAGG